MQSLKAYLHLASDLPGLSEMRLQIKDLYKLPESELMIYAFVHKTGFTSITLREHQMPTTLSTRRPVEDLSASDLEAFPVWEFAVDEEEVEEQDETWVRPIDTLSIPYGSEGVGVAAVLRLANGLTYPGILFCDAYSTLYVSGVAILTTEGRVLFTDSDSGAEIRRTLKRLGVARAGVFPIQYCTRAPLEPNSGYETGAFDVAVG